MTAWISCLLLYVAQQEGSFMMISMVCGEEWCLMTKSR
jgi:hypothetical protein